MNDLPWTLARALDPSNRGGYTYSPPPRATRATKPAGMGTVYFIKGHRYVKIGWTTRTGAIAERLKELQTGSPHSLTVLATEDGKTKQAERALHVRFKKYRRHGEWFTLTGEVLEYVCGLRGWPYPLPKGTARCPRFYERKREQEAILADLTKLITEDTPKASIRSESQK